MKLLKTILSFILIISLVVICIPAYAVSSSKATYEEIHGGNELEQQINAELLAQFDDSVSNSSRGWGVACYPTPPNHQQINNYYCGPACLQIVLEQITGTSQNQSTLGAAAGTNSTDGTYVYRMRNTLNSRQSEYIYAYSQVSSVSSLQNKLDASFSDNAPVIFHAKTGSLAMYSGNNLGHYLVGHTLYQTSEPEAQVMYNDPFSKDYGQGKGNVYGTHTDTISAFYDALTKWGNRYLIYGDYA